MTEPRGTIGCFGEVLLRLGTAPGRRIVQTSNFSVHCGGAEGNVAALLAQLGHDAEVISVLPSTHLGDLCDAELRRVGVATGSLIRRQGRLGLYFFEQALGGTIVYDRHGSAFREHADEFDWHEVAANLSWFHLSGINLALGGKPGRAALAAVHAMRSAGVTVSFDVNHRASLWQGRAPEDIERVRQLAGVADVLFASAWDIGRILNRDVANDAGAAVREAFGAFEQPSVIASTRRTIDANGGGLSARVDRRDDSHETPAAALGTVVDRIGSGDAFAGAVIDALVRRAPLKECAEQGLAAAVMKHGIFGDRWIGTREELDAFDPFAAADLRR